MKIRRFINWENGEKLTIYLSGKELSVEKCINDKCKTTKKNFDTDEEANIQFDKKEWELLKKGYILQNKDCNTYEPVLHYYINNGYTGCLVLEEMPTNEIITQKNGVYEKSEKDFLVFISEEGDIKNTIELPKVLPWSVIYADANKSLYIDNDHTIYELNLQTNTFTPMTSKFEKPASFISSNGLRILYCSHPTLVVRELANGEIVFSKEIDCELYGGHTPQLTGAISPNGKTIALCTKPSEIKILNAETGETINVINIQSQLINKIEFISSGDRLITMGSLGLRVIDINNNTEESYLGLTGVNGYCINRSNTVLAVLQRNKLSLFDFKNRNYIHSFSIEHMVKAANIKFIGDRLAVRTDYGCLSLYKV